MAEVSLFRLYLLRGLYLFIFIGLVAVIWPGLLAGPSDRPLMNGVVICMLAAVSILAAIGIRYPLQMLPLLFFEFLWKAIWCIAVALPRWNAGQIDEATMETVIDCAVGIILVPIAVPWRYVIDHYARQLGDRWRAGEAQAVISDA